MVCVKVSSPIPLIPSMTTAWLVLLFVMLSYYVFNGGIKYNKFLISFIVTAVLGLIIMNPESYFKSWERLFELFSIFYYYHRFYQAQLLTELKK